jgi:acyl carrier protein
MDIFEKVQDVIVDTLSCDKADVTMEASLTDDLGADSLDAVELNMALEEAFGAEIPDEELEKLKTVKDIVHYIEENAA